MGFSWWMETTSKVRGLTWAVTDGPGAGDEAFCARTFDGFAKSVAAAAANAMPPVLRANFLVVMDVTSLPFKRPKQRLFE